MADIADINRIFRQQAQLHHFEICYGNGCTYQQTLQLSKQEWQTVAALFSPMPANAEQERNQIAKAIGVIEILVGAKSETAADKAGTFGNRDYQGQLDCNDESINTTTYLRLLKNQQLMVFHDVVDMKTRNFFLTGWPHTTAVIQETASMQTYAVDSWFYDNGHAAVVLPLAEWQRNYFPEDSPVTLKRNAKPTLPKARLSFTD